MANSRSKSKKSLSSAANSLEVSIDSLRWTCPSAYLKFKSTKELSPLDYIVGQERAVEAIRMGAGLRAKGYNTFVTGLSGTGRLSTVKSILERETNGSCSITNDFCYVNNFANEDEPRLIKLNRGEGRAFAKKMDDAISFLRDRLPKLFEEESYQKSKLKIVESYQAKEKSILDVFDSKIKPFNFMRGQLETEQGMLMPEVFPVIDGKPVAIDSIDEMLGKGEIEKVKADELKMLWRQFHNELVELSREGMKLMQEFRKSLLENDKNKSQSIIDNILDDIAQRFDSQAIAVFIEQVKKHILENLQIFVPTPSTTVVQNVAADDSNDGDLFRVFQVNVILDNSQTDSAPIITETTPSYNNLFGTIERVFDKRGGYWRTDFTKIKAGSLLKADQGYLIVNANDLFSEPGVWVALKRVLLYDRLEIQNFDAYFQVAQAALKPEAIGVKVKVIIIGGLSLYHLLFHQEKGFKKIFKVHAQFDYETSRSEKMIENYSRFISKICADESLPHCSADGVAEIIEWAVESAGSQKRITLKFSDVADILREAAFYSRGSSKSLIGRKVVEIAIAERRKRNDLLDEKIKRQIIDGNMLIDTDGSRIGQINGLTVYNNGFISFGKPARITATISAGNAGIINVEREADLSGNIHNKAVLILTGFLREKFARKRPLSLSASIAFEQSYGGIDGDSATAAEIYIVLSAIACVPIKQNFAITGSVNQKGDIQPIGGVNEKITGFYEICKARGFDGTHGIIIPKQNVEDLMLSHQIIKDIGLGNFRIFAISNIEQGVELLMDITAGAPDDSGNYPKNSLFGMVNVKLDEMYEVSKDKKNKTIGKI